MKRVSAVLMLVMAGLLTFSLTFTPSQAYATGTDDQYLEVPDVRGDLTADTLGGRDDGREGDPDTWGDGFEGEISDEVLGGVVTIPEGLTADDLWLYLMTASWLIW